MICDGLSRQESNELYLSVLEDNDHNALRELCLDDLFFLLTIACKRRDINKDWLFDRCREVQENPNGYLDLWAREHYKALPIDEIVPTPDGWVNHGNIKVNDMVFGINGLPTKVIAKTEIFYNTDCYEIEFTDGTRIKSGKDHLWMVGKRSRKRIVNTNKRVLRENVILDTKSISKYHHNADNRLSIDVSNQIKLPDIELKINPYVLGAWLGDGNSDGSRITCNYNDYGIIKEIEKYYKVKEGKSSNQNSGIFSFGNGKKSKKGTGITPILRSLNVLKNKHIPQEYLRASISQRLSLLQGLMDTDGSCNSRGTATFININEKLINGVFELCASLGLNPKKRKQDIKVNSKNYRVYRVSFQAYKNMPVFRLPRKLNNCKQGDSWGRKYIKSCKKVDSVPISCIQVENKDGMYLVGESFLPTHNSTIITFGLSIQDILKDPDNTTIGIFSHTRRIAKAFLEQIKRELESNTFLINLFPEILYKKPQNDSPKWSLDSGIIVKRKSNPKEATVEAWGLVDGQPTSKHFSILVYDDVVTVESVTTPEQIKKTTAAWEMSLNLGAREGVERYIGTRYHLKDTYSTMIKRQSVISRIKTATHNGKMDGEPVFLSKELLAKKRRDMGPYTFGSQMLQNPVADKAMGFKNEWLRFYKELGDISKWNVYITVDPAGEKKKDNDYSVFEVNALAPDGNYYLVDAVRDRLNLTQRTSELFRLHRKWNPISVGYEKYGKDSDIEHIQDKMEQENYRFEIIALGGSMAKEDRIKKLIPIFEQCRYYMPEKLIFVDSEGVARDYIKEFKEDEYESFPVSTHDDMFDCKARIVDPKLDAKFPKPKPKPKSQPRQSGSGSWMG